LGTSERFVTGSVVLVNWPFADLSGSKIRPAIVVAGIGDDNYILCQVTSQSYHEAAIDLQESDFDSGSLRKKSYILYTQLFTADGSVIIKEVGRLSGRLCERIISRMKEVLDDSLIARLRG
jgi:mRNA interferase MazF